MLGFSFEKPDDAWIHSFSHNDLIVQIEKMYKEMLRSQSDFNPPVDFT